MKKLFLSNILVIITMLISFNAFACECECEGDCSFRAISGAAEFVALVKVIEYSDFLDYRINGQDRKMPFSMTVEIIKKYKGAESRKNIKIWGDDGAQCRPYITNFEIGKYYLIAPSPIAENLGSGEKPDYDFFSCWTDYLTVDRDKKMAFGKYTKRKNKVSLRNFEARLKK